MKQIILPFVIGSLFLFSGCETVDSFLQMKDDAIAQVEEIKNNIEEIQTNIEEKKRQLDEKLAQIDAAQKALSDVFGTNEENNVKTTDDIVKNEEIEISEKKIEQLKKEALFLRQKMQELEYEKNAEKIELQDLEEFSVE